MYFTDKCVSFTVAPAPEPTVAPVAQKPQQVAPPAQQAPQLVEPLRDQHINEGEQVSFQCTIVAHPGKNNISVFGRFVILGWLRNYLRF